MSFWAMYDVFMSLTLFMDRSFSPWLHRSQQPPKIHQVKAVCIFVNAYDFDRQPNNIPSLMEARDKDAKSTRWYDLYHVDLPS